MAINKLNKFSGLAEEELVKILDAGNLSKEELKDLLSAMEEKGLKGTVMAVEDSDSEEGRMAKEYIDYHKKLPQNDPEIIKKEVERSKIILFDKEASIEDKKRALIILAHIGRSEIFRVLEKYGENPDPELRIWVNMAIQECQSFLESNIMGKSILKIGKVTKISRNDPCPCGSGKKYKKCCKLNLQI